MTTPTDDLERLLAATEWFQLHQCDGIACQLCEAIPAVAEFVRAREVLWKSAVGNSDRMAAELTALRAVRDVAELLQGRLDHHFGGTSDWKEQEMLREALATAEKVKP